MLDRQTELLYHPRTLLDPASITCALCLAPHPDDEIFGCAGLLALLVARNCATATLIVTQGDQGGQEQQRRMESEQAARTLGLPTPQFAQFPDRGLVYARPLIDCIQHAIAKEQPSHLLLPALSEPHPDHQALALAGMAAALQSSTVQTLLFYEVGAPLHANCIIDITAVASAKWQAVQAFASQLGVQAYEQHARAFASLRAFGMPSECTAAEAYFQVKLNDVRSQGPAAAMPYWPLLRTQRQLANTPAQLPLVSVLVRSVDRPQLPQAIASVAAQTYPHIEVIVLNASGHAHSPPGYPPHRMALKLVEPPPDPLGMPVTCSRARAANLALQAASGELALFLDDDDLLDPTHIERLVQALSAQTGAVAAYAGVRVETVDGVFLRNYDLPWSSHRLNGINYLPIHAVLFRLPFVRAARARFDEDLPVLEDWSFWKQLARLGDMVHCPGVSALYRQGLGASGLGNPDGSHYWKDWHARLLERFVVQSTPDALASTLAWHAIALDRAQLDLETLQCHSQIQYQKQLAEIDALQTFLQDAQDKLQRFSQESHTALHDQQRRMDAFVLESQAALQAKQDVIERFSSESQAALQAKQDVIERFSSESQAALQVKQDLIERFSSESQAALQVKQDLIERFSSESQAALQAKQEVIESLSRESQAVLAAHQQALEATRRETDSLQIRLANMANTECELRTQLDRVTASLQNQQTSLSWRVTAPLRTLSSWVRGQPNQ